MHNIVDNMDSWGLTHSGLFTFSHSPKHLALYQLYGFQPRFLTPVLSAPAGTSRSSVGWSNYSVDPDPDRRLADCASPTDSIYPSLDSLIRLLDACETFATAQGAGRVVAGVSTARRDAYRMLGQRGYRAD